MSRRVEKVNELLRHEIARLVFQELVMPEVTVTTVETTPDLRQATVYLQTLDETSEQLIIDRLEAAGHGFSAQLFERLDLKYVPVLFFKIDHSPQYAKRIEQILTELEKTEST